MEPDGISRLYYYHTTPLVKVVEAWPNRASFNKLEESSIYGLKAKDVYNRADFFCISVSYGDGSQRKHKHVWRVSPKGRPYNEIFHIWRKHVYSDQDYIDLIKKLEKLSCKKGLTILIS